MLAKVNLQNAFGRVSEANAPKITAEVSDMYVKLVKFQGPFAWHLHENADELFLVIKGHFTMKLRDGDVHIGENEFIIVPSGVEHCPAADAECQVMLFKPKTSTMSSSSR